MALRYLSSVGPVLVFGAAFFALAPPAALGRDQRPTGPAPRPRQPRRDPSPRPLPPPRPPAKPDRSFEITFISVDAGRDAVPDVSAFLAANSNHGEQIAGLQARAKRGVSIFQVSDGPTLRVSQDDVDTRYWDAPRTRVTVRPHLNPRCAEAVDISLEQAPPGTPLTAGGIHTSLVFENGDTRLLSETALPGGARHLVYVTVFFLPRPPACPR